jgi:hypothetical protein
MIKAVIEVVVAAVVQNVPAVKGVDLAVEVVVM